MVIKRYSSRAPTRIDLAGGTIDIWPIYLFLKRPLTLNLAIDLYAEAVLEVSDDHVGTVELVSEDQNLSSRFSWGELEAVQMSSGLELHYKLLRFFYKKNSHFKGSIVLKTRATSPAGAGLGGSSSLSIALIGVLAQWTDFQDEQGFIDIVRDIETTVIKIPAGLQDYYAAVYGGLQALEWQAGVHAHDSLDEGLAKELQDRLLLFYSGKSRNSGINNWSLFESFLDGDTSVHDQFQKIASSAEFLREALLERDWTKVGKAISSEWEVRKTLASGISTPVMDQAFQIAQKLGVSGKVCGAGGGGCFFLYLPTHQINSECNKLKEKLISELQTLGIENLSFKVSLTGLFTQLSP